MKFNREKFKALVHYICRECRDPDKLGMTKLHKILWYSDGQSYVRRGEPITGERYIKMEYGPYADHLSAVLTELQKENKVHTRKVEFQDKEKYEIIGKGQPDTSLFTEKELSLVDGFIKHVTEDHTAESISERTHNAIWKMAIMREEIPYEALIAKFVSLNDEDMEWAKSIIPRK